jgi:peptide/nickel transport system permease protein
MGCAAQAAHPIRPCRLIFREVLVRYLVQRLLRFLVVFFLVTFGLMVLMRLGMNKPGDPARTMLGGTVSEAQIADTTAHYHLHAPLIVQYGYWLKGMVTFDMGISVQQNLRVSTYISSRVLSTVFLGMYSLGLAIIVAIPVAVFQAYRRDSKRDKLLSASSFAFVAIPPVVMGVFLILVFVRWLHWFPRTGEKVYPWDSPTQHIRNFALPVLALSLPVGAVFSRLLRGDMVRTLQSDFITLASAKGVSTRRILWRHALRNSLFSLITSIGLQLAGIVGGSIVVEQLFNMKGMGTLLITAILSKDLFVVQALAAIIVAVVVFVNLLVDLSYAVVDPRIRQMRALS